MRGTIKRVEAAAIGALRGKRWRTEDAQRVLAAWRASGLSARVFGREHGLDAQRLWWWKKRLGAWEEPSALTVGSIVPAVVGHRGLVSDAAVLVRVPSGVEIEVRTDGVSPEWLGSLIGTLVER